MEEPNDVVADRIVRDLLVGQRQRTGDMNFTINAGALSVWVAAGACMLALCFMLGASVVGVAWMVDRFGSIDREFGRVDNKFSDAKNTNDIQDAYIEKLRSKQQQQQPEKK